MSIRSRVKLWSIGGGKGGVGKSVFTLGLAVCLAEMGKKVILIDGDLGGANLHTLMGVRFPSQTLEDFLLRRIPRLEDIIMETEVNGIGLICGADDIMGSANPTYSQKVRLMQQIESLPADFVLLDLGAGTSFNTLDLFNASPGKIVVFTNQVTSLQNAYGFIKSALFRHLCRAFSKDDDVLSLIYQIGDKESEEGIQSIHDLYERLQERDRGKGERLQQMLDDFQLYLLINMVKSSQDVKSSDIIQTVCSDFLNLQPQVLGSLAYDPAVEAAVNQMTPFPLYQKRGRATATLREVARNFMIHSRLTQAFSPSLAAASGGG